MGLHTVLFELELLRGNMALPKDFKSNNSFSKLPSELVEQVNEVPETVTLDRRGSHGLRGLLLKGQMRYIKEIDSIVFLCSPL